MFRAAGPPPGGAPGPDASAAGAAGAGGGAGGDDGLDVSVTVTGSLPRTLALSGPVGGVLGPDMFTATTTRVAAPPTSRAARNRRRFGSGTARPYGASTSATPTPLDLPLRCPGVPRLGICRAFRRSGPGRVEAFRAPPSAQLPTGCTLRPSGEIRRSPIRRPAPARRLHRSRPQLGEERQRLGGKRVDLLMYLLVSVDAVHLHAGLGPSVAPGGGLRQMQTDRHRSC